MFGRVNDRGCHFFAVQCKNGKLKWIEMVWLDAVTKNILANEQMTTTQTSTAYWTSTAFAVATTKTLTSSTVQSTQKQKPKPRWKWSGEEDALERGWDDTDTMTLTRKEINYMRWYNTHRNWHNADED